MHDSLVEPLFTAFSAFTLARARAELSPLSFAHFCLERYTYVHIWRFGVCAGVRCGASVRGHKLRSLFALHRAQHGLKPATWHRIINSTRAHRISFLHLAGTIRSVLRVRVLDMLLLSSVFSGKARAVWGLLHTCGNKCARHSRVCAFSFERTERASSVTR